MAKIDMWRSPFAPLNREFPEGLSEIPYPGQVNLRGNPEDPDFLSGVKKALKLDLPLKPNTVSSLKDTKILWLGPDEWLVVTSGEADDVVSKLEKALKGQHVAVTNVGANRVVLQLSGPHCHEVLMKSCNMDFHPSVFGPGRVAQTMLAKSQAIIEQVAADSFHIYIRNSFAKYCAEWLVDAFEEYSDETV